MHSSSESLFKKRQHDADSHLSKSTGITTNRTSSVSGDKERPPLKKRVLADSSFFPTTSASLHRGKDRAATSYEKVACTLRTNRNKGHERLLTVFLAKERVIIDLSPRAPLPWKDEVSGILFGLFSETADDNKRKKISNILKLMGIEKEDIKTLEEAIELFCDGKINPYFAHYKTLAGKMKGYYFNNNDCDQSYLFFLLQAQLLRPRKTHPFGTVIQETGGRLLLNRSHTQSSAAHFGATKPDMPAAPTHQAPEKDKKTMTSVVSSREAPNAVITAASTGPIAPIESSVRYGGDIHDIFAPLSGSPGPGAPGAGIQEPLGDSSLAACGDKDPCDITKFSADDVFSELDNEEFDPDDEEFDPDDEELDPLTPRAGTS